MSLKAGNSNMAMYRLSCIDSRPHVKNVCESSPFCIRVDYSAAVACLRLEAMAYRMEVGQALITRAQVLIRQQRK